MSTFPPSLLDLSDAIAKGMTEAAAKMPLKLLFPLIFALFPALMVVLLGPAGIQLARQLGAIAGG